MLSLEGGKKYRLLKTQLDAIKEQKTKYQDQYNEVTCPQPLEEKENQGNVEKEKQRDVGAEEVKTKKSPTKKSPTKKSQRKKSQRKRTPKRKRAYIAKNKPPKRTPNNISLTVQEMESIKEDTHEKAFRKLFHTSGIETTKPNKLVKKKPISRKNYLHLIGQETDIINLFDYQL